MRFVTMKDLRSRTAAIRKDLAADEEIVLTANGRPIALLTAVDDENLEEELLHRRRARARAALERTRALAGTAGTSNMPMSKVDEVVKAVRKVRKRPT